MHLWQLQPLSVTLVAGLQHHFWELEVQHPREHQLRVRRALAWPISISGQVLFPSCHPSGLGSRRRQMHLAVRGSAFPREGAARSAAAGCGPPFLMLPAPHAACLTCLFLSGVLTPPLKSCIAKSTQGHSGKSQRHYRWAARCWTGPRRALQSRAADLWSSHSDRAARSIRPARIFPRTTIPGG